MAANIVKQRQAPIHPRYEFLIQKMYEYIIMVVVYVIKTGVALKMKEFNITCKEYPNC